LSTNDPEKGYPVHSPQGATAHRIRYKCDCVGPIAPPATDGPPEAGLEVSEGKSRLPSALIQEGRTTIFFGDNNRTLVPIVSRGKCRSRLNLEAAVVGGVVRLSGRNPHYTGYEQVLPHMEQKIIAESKKEPEKA